MVNCSCCGKNDEPHRMIKCCVCGNAYLIDCVSVSSAAARHINSDPSVSWTCPSCKNIGSDMNGLKSVILQLQQEISDLKKSIKASAAPMLTLMDTEKIVQEVANRERRKCNIILYRVPEMRNVDKKQQTDHDGNLAKAVSSFLGVSETGEFHTSRLGRYDPSRQNPARPIKVRLSSESAVIAVLRNCHRLKESEWSHISVSRDQTPMQSELYKQIRVELRRRIEDGETNLRIKYKNGIPAIISSPSEN